MLRPQVFDHLVRLQHVAADLASEAHALLVAPDLVELGLASLALDVGQLGLEHRHGPVAVLELAALDLAGHHDPGGDVRQSNGRRGLVDVLSAGARRPEDVHLDVLLVDLDRGVALVEHRHHLQGGEGRLALALGVERADAHQPVHAPLGLQVAVCVAPVDDQLGRRDAGLGARRAIVELGVEAPALGPACDHAQQHLGPVLRIDPALAGLDRHQRVALVVLAREHRLQLDPTEVGVDGRERSLDLGQRRLVALVARQLVDHEVPGRLVDPPPQPPQLIAQITHQQSSTTERRSHPRGVERHLPWHCLNFLPDPQGQGALRGVLSHSDFTTGVLVCVAVAVRAAAPAPFRPSAADACGCGWAPASPARAAAAMLAAPPALPPSSGDEYWTSRRAASPSPSPPAPLPLPTLASAAPDASDASAASAARPSGGAAVVASAGCGWLTWTCTCMTYRMKSDQTPCIICPNMSKPSRCHSTSGSFWPMAR